MIEVVLGEVGLFGRVAYHPNDEGMGHSAHSPNAVVLPVHVVAIVHL